MQKNINGMLFLLFVLILIYCDSSSTDIDPMTVRINCFVTHVSPISGEIMATEDAVVDILNTSRKPVQRGISLTSFTDSLGIATIITNSEVLFPKNTYIASVSYPASSTSEKEFQVPQYPNNVKEYIINLEIGHNIGDDPNYIPKVKIQVYVQEKIQGTDSLQNSATAEIGLYDIDGIHTPVPDDFVYTETTNNEGYAEFEVSSDYFLPGSTYAVKASKLGYLDKLVEFTVPFQPQGLYYIVIVNIILE